MKYHSIGAGALLALLISAGLATAQTTSAPTFETTVTTGIVGWAPGSQTAQLNVLNTGGLVAVATTITTTAPTPVAACPVELEFHDAQDKVLKTLEVSNLAAGTAASLTLKLSDLPAATTAPRLDIRGVVKSNPIVSGPIPAGSAPVIPAFPFLTCSVMPTLELFETSTSVTQTFTSDTRLFGTPQIVPLTTTLPIKN
jgi:hypothetical protein